MKSFLFLKLNTISQYLGFSTITSFFILFLIFIPVFYYFSFLIINIIGLSISKSSSYTRHSYKKSVSVIIAIRNGASSLPQLIDSLINQDYKGDLEFILIDDQSVDQSKEIINNVQIHDDRFKYVSSKEGQESLNFKKKALNAGIKKSQNSILLFTDVDCILPSSWVQSMASLFDDDIVDYVIGFSRSKHIYGLANLFQRIDFLMLMFSSAATCKVKYPLASSGQNQAYKRELFDRVGGYNKISNLLMGDDSVFLQLCLKENINVKFSMNQSSFVYCRPEKKWVNFFLQRIRWAGDGKIMWKYNFNFFLIMCSTVFVNLLIIILLFINWDWFLLVLILLKFFLELTIALLGAQKFNEKLLFSDFIFWFILNVPYVVIMCIASFFVKFIPWQGRQQKC